jgi:hypothetical protein
MTHYKCVRNGGSSGSLWYMKKKSVEDGQYKIYKKNKIITFKNRYQYV